MKQTLFDALAPPTEEEQQEAFCSMVNFEYFCNKFAGEIGDWLEENDPNDIMKRAERIDRQIYENMTPKQLKQEERDDRANIRED